jgi:hypothetical protein
VTHLFLTHCYTKEVWSAVGGITSGKGNERVKTLRKVYNLGWIMRRLERPITPYLFSFFGHYG